MGHVYRTYNAYCEGKAGSTPLERLREKRGGQAPRSYPFGAVGFLKPIHPSKWPCQRLVLCHFLGMRYVTGGGCLGYPFSVDAEGYRQVIKGHSFKLKEPLQYDVESLFFLFWQASGYRTFQNHVLKHHRQNRPYPHLTFHQSWWIHRFFQRKRLHHNPLQMELMAWGC